MTNNKKGDIQQQNTPDSAVPSSAKSNVSSKDLKKKDDKKKQEEEELSEEDQKLKSELEMLVERLKVCFYSIV